MADDKEKTKETSQYTGYNTVRPMHKLDSTSTLEASEKRQKELKK